MTAFETVSLIVGVLGVLVGVVSIFVLRAKSLPRLQFDITERPSFPDIADGKSVLDIKLDQTSVLDPHEVTLSQVATGSRNVRKSDFDGDLVLNLGAPLVAIVDRGEISSSYIKGDRGDTEISVAPHIWKRGKLYQVSAVVEGKPTAEIGSDEADMDLVKFNVSDFGRQQTSKTRLATYALVGLTTAMIVGGFGGWFASQRAHQQVQSVQSQLNDVTYGVHAAAGGLQSALQNPDNPQSVNDVKAAIQRLQCLGTNTNYSNNPTYDRSQPDSSYRDAYCNTYGNYPSPAGPLSGLPGASVPVGTFTSPGARPSPPPTPIPTP